MSGSSDRTTKFLQHSTLSQNGIPPLQFIVALLLAKSKPLSLSIEGENHISRLRGGKACAHLDSGYIISLRSCIVSGVRPEVSSNSSNYVDTIAFWREAHRKLEKAQVALRAKAARVVELESVLEELSVTYNASPVSGHANGKRKRPVREVASATTRKRAKKGQVLEEDNGKRRESPAAPTVEIGLSSEEGGMGK